MCGSVWRTAYMPTAYSGMLVIQSCRHYVLKSVGLIHFYVLKNVVLHTFTSLKVRFGAGERTGGGGLAAG